ncbi:MGMT family protein [Spizellomyces punctatus DAOM BR117]|uniref:MGMT family protein n=1 Tax=Spizellomyces punctatus (strain DAOM BR117) TaxID=645134 RepID=A0A0L0HAM8_SPIPD|nr:MGMT family protein [Spizellomyces punctatus DAOM BR117]KNC97763.1 MGMT family protein [Spizellomyces punctatus DAOM BR117]|eukprot:XP_016605803.1 MGMT family protein [Spizellomyces punctatus DAOM BR117]
MSDYEDFRASVLNVIQQIPKGRVTSYGMKQVILQSSLIIQGMPDTSDVFYGASMGKKVYGYPGNVW